MVITLSSHSCPLFVHSCFPSYLPLPFPHVTALPYCRYIHCICYLCYCATQVGNFPGMIATPAEWADNAFLKQRLATQVITCHYADPVTMRAIHDLLADQLEKAEGADTS